MKCEKCNKNEATFHYSCNMNGKKTELHLCSDCAQQAGFGDMMAYQPAMFGNFFEDFFRPSFPFLPGFGNFGGLRRGMMSPMMTLPQIRILIGDEAEAENEPESQKEIPDKADEEVKARRELNALKEQLDEAVKQQNFEKAIELRDKIKQLEK